MGYQASTLLTMLLNELLHSLPADTHRRRDVPRRADCHGQQLGSAMRSCGDSTIVEIEPVLLARGPPGRPG